MDHIKWLLIEHSLLSFQDNQLAQVENDISRDLMAISNVQTQLRNLEDILKQLNEEIRQKNETALRIENDIVKKNAVIERKQNTVDQYNKRIEAAKNKDGVSHVYSCVHVGLLFLVIRILQSILLVTELLYRRKQGCIFFNDF